MPAAAATAGGGAGDHWVLVSRPANRMLCSWQCAAQHFADDEAAARAAFRDAPPLVVKHMLVKITLRTGRNPGRRTVGAVGAEWAGVQKSALLRPGILQELERAARW